MFGNQDRGTCFTDLRLGGLEGKVGAIYQVSRLGNDAFHLHLFPYLYLYLYLYPTLDSHLISFHLASHHELPRLDHVTCRKRGLPWDAGHRSLVLAKLPRT